MSPAFFRPRLLAAVACLAACAASLPAGPLVLEAPSGPPTPAEIDGFKAWMKDFEPASDNVDVAWGFGHSGQALEALGYLYVATSDRAFLEKLTALSSTALSERNDLAPAPVGHRPLWSGVDSPAWANQPLNAGNSGHAGPETGDVAGRIGFTAYLILHNPALAREVVRDGDPYRFGRTFGERALTFVHRLDETAEKFVVPYFVRMTEHDLYYYPTDRRYDSGQGGGTENAGRPVPWNQQFMLSNLLMRLAQCHEILADAPEKVAFYDTCVRNSIAWFMSSASSEHDSHGHGVYYLWSYTLGDTHHIEDGAHEGLDMEGLYRCYLSGRYKDVVGIPQMQGFANGFVDIQTLSNGRWAGSVDGSSKGGHAGLTEYPRPNLLLLLEFRPDAYARIAQAAITAKRTSGDVTALTRLVWARLRISQDAAAR